jgi:hypothetical protein
MITSAIANIPKRPRLNLSGSVARTTLAGSNPVRIADERPVVGSPEPTATPLSPSGA